MASYFGARQRKSDGRWDYTVSNTCGSYMAALGYCRAWVDPPSISLTEEERLLPFKDKFHSDGHATEEEAEACYKQYLLDNELRFSEDKDTQRQCAVCGEWTTGRGWIGLEFSCVLAVCPQHQNAESVKPIYMARKGIW